MDKQRKELVYQVCSQTRLFEGFMVTQYGLSCVEGTGKELKRIDDITVDFEKAVSLAKVLTENEVSLLHFSDVVEDFLFEV